MGMPNRILGKVVVVLFFCTVPLSKSLFVAGQVIPPVAGRVVDAVTQQPIEGL
jgi:hypothetical protein